MKTSTLSHTPSRAGASINRGVVPSPQRAARWAARWLALLWLFQVSLIVIPSSRRQALVLLAPLGDAAAWLGGLWVLALGLGCGLLMWGLSRAMLLLQMGALVFLSVVLAWSDLWLLVHPMGVITKQIPYLALLWVFLWLPREGLTERLWWWLRVGMAFIWWSEGLFPKIFFQQALELKMVTFFRIDFFVSPSQFLLLLGLAQFVSGVVVLFLWGRWLRWLLWCQFLAMLLLPLLVLMIYPEQLVHPLMPLVKNIPICLGTYLLICWQPMMQGERGSGRSSLGLGIHPTA